MLRKFYKMHGIGNDYIYFDCMEEELEDVERLAMRLSDRHFSIGGDGIILLCPSKIADCKMRIFNADGSEAQMCGNGIRCVGKLARDLGYVKSDFCYVETLAGIKELTFSYDKSGMVDKVIVNMGKAILNGELIPSTIKGESVVNKSIKVGDKKYEVTLVSMGNPHCVVFIDPDNLDIEKVGPLFENSPYFPERINTEFVKVISPTHLKMRVWERGSGETWACGTGACATAVAAILNGYAEEGEDIRVQLRGGDLTICYSNGEVFMEGSATLAFTGTVEI